MKTFLETNFDESRRAALSQIAWMHQKNLTDAERHGGVEHLRANPALDAAKRFLGIERRLIELAAFDDAAMEYITELSSVLEAQAETIHRQNAELRRYKALEKTPLEPAATIDFRSYLLLMLNVAPVPRKIGAMIELREGKRTASRLYATSTQPHLF